MLTCWLSLISSALGAVERVTNHRSPSKPPLRLAMGRLRRRPSEATVVNIAIRVPLMNLRSFRTSFSIGASGASAFFAILSPPLRADGPNRASAVSLSTACAHPRWLSTPWGVSTCVRPGSCIDVQVVGAVGTIRMVGTLTSAQKDSLRDRGYVVLSGLVPRPRHEAALRAINASLGRGLHPEDVPRMRAQSFCPELQKADVILDLFRETAASGAAASLVGREGLERVTTAQIALSFPSDGDAGARPHPHLDGMYSPDNGVPAG